MCQALRILPTELQTKRIWRLFMSWPLVVRSRSAKQHVAPIYPGIYSLALTTQNEKQLLRALGLVRQKPGKIKVAAVKPGSFAEKWGVEAGSDIVEVKE